MLMIFQASISQLVLKAVEKYAPLAGSNSHCSFAPVESQVICRLLLMLFRSHSLPLIVETDEFQHKNFLANILFGAWSPCHGPAFLCKPTFRCPLLLTHSTGTNSIATYFSTFSMLFCGDRWLCLAIKHFCPCHV